jgi:hypothetical protein
VIFGSAHRNLHCGLDLHIENRNIFSFIKQIRCVVPVYSLYLLACLLYWKHYDCSCEIWSLHCMMIFFSSNSVCGLRNLHAFLYLVLSWLLSCEVNMYFLSYFVKLYTYVAISLDLIQRNMVQELWKRNNKLERIAWTGNDVLFILRTCQKKKKQLARFNATTWHNSERVDSSSNCQKCFPKIFMLLLS